MYKIRTEIFVSRHEMCICGEFVRLVIVFLIFLCGFAV